MASLKDYLFYEEPSITLYCGDALTVLRKMPGESVQCAVTSPPYWGLRDYGLEPLVWDDPGGCEHEWGAEERGRRGDLLPAEESASASRMGKDESQGIGPPSGGRFCAKGCGSWRGSLGLEPTPDLYVEHVVEIFREIRRVLRDDGTAWCNLGDSYSSGDKSSYQVPDNKNKAAGVPIYQPNRLPVAGLKPKDLIGVPWRVAFALQADGWWLRSDIIWAKPNPMPESVTDRPTKSHEYLFLLSKSATYYYDAEAIKEPGNPENWRGSPTSRRGNSQRDSKLWERRGEVSCETRNRRTVWEIPTAPFPEAHFATFPPALVKPCILAGTSERGACPTCGAPWERVMERTGHINQREVAHQPGNTPTKVDSTGWAPTSQDSGAWRPTCRCGTDETRPCVVLDPFAGSGTVIWVAKELSRRAIGIDLNPTYLAMAAKRLRQEVLAL